MDDIRFIESLHCPHPELARKILGLSVDQFCRLLEIDLKTYTDWVSGTGGPSINQRIFLKEAIRIFQERFGGLQ